MSGRFWRCSASEIRNLGDTMNFPSLEQLEIDALSASVSNSRRRILSAAELLAGQTIYGGAIDFTKVEVVPHALPVIKDRPFTMRNRIHIPEAWFCDDIWAIGGDPRNVWYYRTVLMHELCHVWQYQTPSMHYHWILALLESIRYGGHVYDFDIHEHKCLKDYRFEQQGQILQEYSVQVLRYQFRDPVFRDVIDCCIPQPPASTGAPPDVDWKESIEAP